MLEEDEKPAEKEAEVKKLDAKSNQSDDEDDTADWSLKTLEHIEAIITSRSELLHLNLSGLGLKKTAIFKLGEAIK